MESLAITAAGMVTSVGFNWAATCAAIRGGLRSVEASNLWDSSAGAPLPAGRVILPQWWTGVEKLADLVAPAILECLEAARPVPPDEIPLLIGIAPPDRPLNQGHAERKLLNDVAQRLELVPHAASGVIARDHVAGAHGLRAAAQLMARHHVPYVIVAAVDSLLDEGLVAHYISQQRVLTAQVSNGFYVGEAGSAVLVSSIPSQSDGLHVLGIGVSREAATIESDEPCRAEGLTKAVADALNEAQLTIHDVQYRISDLNGEHYKFKEMALTMMRFERKPRPQRFELWHPIEFIGDVGAAISPLALGLALDAGRRGYANGPNALCTFGNDNGERAAIVVSYQPWRVS
jgi:3-oxoacyl-[acyl-carrier-protein] synthase-1